MGLKEELKLYRPIETLEHECILNIVYTSSMLSKAAYNYFSKFNLTEAQFNMLMQLKYSEKEGVSQVSLSKRLFVNKADITGLVDRLEKLSLVQREAHAQDRRIKIIKITKEGLQLLARVEHNYFKEVNKLMGSLGKTELNKLIHNMEKIRNNIRKTSF